MNKFWKWFTGFAMVALVFVLLILGATQIDSPSRPAAAPSASGSDSDAAFRTIK